MFGSDRVGPVERQRLGLLAHDAFAAGAGITYALFVSRIPAIGRGAGCLYGSLVWGAADELAVPALGLSRGPRELAVRTSTRWLDISSMRRPCMPSPGDRTTRK
ncbi:MAG TPA: hypothetical protein VD833_00945 [Vicinamibacterales bacterium]|nr:hypothetical protein [Vicinamibacterales bacterium]